MWLSAQSALLIITNCWVGKKMLIREAQTRDWKSSPCSLKTTWIWPFRSEGTQRSIMPVNYLLTMNWELLSKQFLQSLQRICVTHVRYSHLKVLSFGSFLYYLLIRIQVCDVSSHADLFTFFFSVVHIYLFIYFDENFLPYYFLLLFAVIIGIFDFHIPWRTLGILDLNALQRLKTEGW